MTLCTQTDVELYGSVDFTSEPDAAVTLWRAGATKAIENYCGRPLLRESGRVDRFTALGEHKLRLPLYPVDVVTTLTESGVALAEGTDFLVDVETGLLRRVEDGDIPRTWRYRGRLDNIVVTYTAGYEDGDATNDIPADLRMACAVAVGDLFRAGQRWANSGGADIVSINEVGSLTFNRAASQIANQFAGELSQQVRGLLGPYRRYHLAVGGATA